MKNEERIIELLTEYIQRFDRHMDEQKAEKAIQAKLNQELSEEIRRLNVRWDSQQEDIRTTLGFIQKQQENLDWEIAHNRSQDEAIKALLERSEAIHVSNLQMQESARELTTLVVAHHRMLLEHEQKLK